MPETPSIAKLFGTGLAAMLVMLALMIAIPHNPYIRWQAMRTEAYARLGWDYERIHFDRTPIDIALIGTSHTMNGIDGQAVADRMAADGLRGAGGQCLTVANLAIPSYGRNLHWLITRELLKTRKPRAVVIEVFENETRKPHPLFSHIATTADMLHAPVLFNINYAADLVRLPYRQLKLGVESLAPAEFGLKPRFDPADYDGSTVDNTRIVNVNGHELSPPLTHVMDPANLEAEAASLRTQKNLHMLPRSLENFEYAVPRTYVRQILELADRLHTPVYFMYLPGYGQPARPYDMRLYQGRPMLSFNDLLAHREFWHDVHHLNAQGAAAVSVRLGDLLARDSALKASQSGRMEKCGFGYLPRKALTPFSRHASFDENKTID